MRSRFAVCSFVFLAVAASGCVRWTRPAPVAPSTLGAHLGKLRVTLTAGRSFVLSRARVQGDSLLGDTLGETPASWKYQPLRVAIPIADIRSVSSREFSLGRTALLAGAGSVGLVLVMAVGFTTGRSM